MFNEVIPNRAATVAEVIRPRLLADLVLVKRACGENKNQMAQIKQDVESYLHLEQFRDTVNAFAFSPDGKTVLVGNKDGVVRLWDVAAGNAVTELGTRRTGIVERLQAGRKQTLLRGRGPPLAQGRVAASERDGGPGRRRA